MILVSWPAYHSVDVDDIHDALDALPAVICMIERIDVHAHPSVAEDVMEPFIVFRDPTCDPLVLELL